MSKKRSFTVTVKDYGDDEINKFAVICKIFDDFNLEQRGRTFRFIASKYEQFDGLSS